MRKFCSVLSAPFLLMLAGSVLLQGAQAQTVVKDRITQAIDSSNMVPLTGTVHPLAKPEYDQGLTDNAKVLQGMTLNFQRTAAQAASLQALLQAQQNPASPSYHQWLTPAQFAAQFGMSPADIAKVSAWLQGQGFSVTTVAQSSNAIGFNGSVASVERAFQTQIHNYSLNGEQHFANATQISLPSVLAGMVAGVRGLDDFRPRPKVLFPKAQPGSSNPRFTSGISGQHFLAPGDFATIYDLNPLYSAGDTGKGLTIAIIGRSDIVPADITEFRAAAGLSVNNPTVVTVPGSTPESVAVGEANSDLVESDLDLEWSGGVAPGASIILVNSSDVFTSLQYAIQNTINGISIPIVSLSFGACEAQTPTAEFTQIESFLQQANSQGQTVILAAGDTGAADCDDTTPPTTAAVGGLQVDYPSSSAYVTSIGGSEYTGDGTAAAPQNGADTYWNSNGTAGVSDDLLTSAKSYIPEMAWNDTAYAITQNQGLAAGGGGASLVFSKPSWQTGVPGIPADNARDVPDVSLNGSPAHDGYLYCTQVQTAGSGAAFVSSCTNNTFRISDPGQTDDDSLVVAGGTSFGAPSFAGLLAIIEQKLGASAPGGLGNINPSLYTLAANATTYASAFHDITAGNNQVPCVDGSPNCAATGSNNVIGYVAGTGYDQATGLGSVDGNNLATAFTALVTATGTITTLTAAPATLTSGQSVTLTATVTPNTPTTAPTGTVTFTVDGVAGTPVAISASSPYTAAFATTFTTGTHTVSATFTSTNTTYTGSSSTALTLSVASSGVAATTTTVTANPTTIQLGGTVAFTATISGGTPGTLTGPVTFTTGGITIGTVKQVTIGTGNTATATLNVSSAAASLGFAPGTDTITASYGGDSFNATSSGTTSITVTNPGITVAATDITIASPNPNNSATSTVTLTSTGGYSGTANVTATASLNADYGFGSTDAQTVSVALAAGASGTTTLTITTIAANGNVRKGVQGNFRKHAAQIAAAGGTAAGCILLLLIPGIRKKRWPVALSLLVFLSVGAGLGCGGGTGGASPAGAYTVTVTATDSSNPNITGSGNFTVTIR